MNVLNFKLSDDNYTVRAQTNLSLDRGKSDELRTLISFLEDGLSWEKAAYLTIEGLDKKPIKLTITEMDQ